MNYFIIERTNGNEKQFLTALPEGNGGFTWAPWPKRAFHFESAVLAEVQRLELVESAPNYNYTIYQATLQLSPIEVTIKHKATTRGGGRAFA